MAIIANDTQFIGIAPSVDLTEKKSALLNAQTEPVTMQDIIDTVGGGGGLEGSNYIFVAADGTDVENAAELKAAYTLATTMAPAYDNVITIVAAPGKYNFGVATFTMNMSYINLVSLDGNRSIVFNSFSSSGLQGTISVATGGIFVRGVDTTVNGFKPFDVQPNMSCTIENCRGGDYSFCYGGSSYSTYTNCIAGNFSFCAGIGNAAGIYNNCSAQGFSFGYGSSASGTFNNCEGNAYCFAGGGGNAFGTYYNCIAGDISFGAYFGGTANNCIAGPQSYGFAISLTGKLYYCRLTNSGTFQTVSAGGRTVLCIDGLNNQNNQ